MHKGYGVINYHQFRLRAGLDQGFAMNYIFPAYM
jgi:hypothetical protein